MDPAQILGGTPGPKVKAPKSTKELLIPVVAAVYGVPALLLREEHWKLTEEEASDLTDALDDFIQSLPDGTGKKVNKLLKQYAPSLALVLTAAAITGPRLKTSLDKRRARVPAPPQPAAVPPAVVPAPRADRVDGAGADHGVDGEAAAGPAGRPGPTAARILGGAD